MIAHRVAYQWNLCQTWEWAFLAPWDEMFMNCPQNHGQIYDYKGALPTENWHLPSTSPLQLLPFNIPWKEFRVEIRNEALCALGRTGRTGLQVDIFRRFYEPKFLHLLISRKALKSLMVTSALAVEERNSSGSKNGVAVSDSEATSHSQSSVCRSNCNQAGPCGYFCQVYA